MNKVILYGNLTRDPELKSLPSGIALASFGLATNRRFKDKDGNWTEQPEFHNIVVFGRQAETSAQYLKKGASALIEGRIQTRSWEKDGQKNYRTEIVAERVQFAGGKSGGSSSAPQSREDTAPSKESPSNEAGIDYPQEDINPDDIPF